ncbi:YcjX family protein [Propylenella binzhouense]|uniref:YcjX family protein n=1 Tax=Propylenella binzhouense TaxID=2555902 RepID=A0A964T7F0_9HYPH|nr:YcjX family protein [Propylenella binzhouense]MYZ49921.1 YcjX family protein [Propylenella binzhouense]
MASITTFTDEARIAVDNVLGALVGGTTPTVRLGVTGLSRAGKTVFITALVHNLVHGGRLPLFEAYASGRLAEAGLQPQPDDEVPRFDYEAHVRDLVSERVWPRSTRRISELRVTIAYESASGLRRTFGPGRLNLDIVDYPGEWLLDLALLRKSFAEWSAEAVRLSREPHRLALAAGWHAALHRTGADAPEDEAAARELAETFTHYLRAARADEHALSMLPPGRFLMPGDLEGSPALTFAPLDIPPDHRPARGSMAAMMARRYEAYRTHVVKPFFRDHFARLDRQIVLVDMLAALNAGPAAMRDLETALADVLACFRPGRASWLTAILTRRIDRILFAATKADHVHHSDHDNLARLLARLTKNAATRAAFAGASVRVMPLAAVRATREVTIERGAERLPALVGTPLAGETVDGETYDGSTEIALFPGDLPGDPDSLFEPQAGARSKDALALRYLRFRPPRLERTAEGTTLSLPHIRLDQAIEYLIGDRLR